MVAFWGIIVMNSPLRWSCIAFLMLVSAMRAQAADAPLQRPFVIEIRDEATNRPVPLVEIYTVHQLSHVTDNAGVTAWAEPELMGEEVFFQVRSHGYEFQADGFGYRGKRVKVEPGGRVTWKMRRLQVAERLCRITGAGRLAESQTAGIAATDDPNAITKAKVTGQDSVQMVPYKGELHWLWGDTSRLSYPLGNFQSPSARTPLPGPKTWGPEKEIPLKYFIDSKTGFAAETCRIAGDGPTWVGAMATVQNDKGEEKLVGWYAKIKPPMTTYERGVAVWNDAKAHFEPLRKFGPEPVGPPDGSHDLKIVENGQAWIYFTDPFPYARVKATQADFSEPKMYEYWTCLKEGSTAEKPQVDRDSNGKIQFAWHKNATAWNQKAQKELLARKLIKPDECPIQLKTEKGDELTTARGTVAWNAYRRKWVMVFGQLYGKSSLLGEIWYAEADEITGPWQHAVKIITHDKYSFYNVAHQKELDSPDGKAIYIEGTYTTLFSGNEHPTPRYDYNQILYKVDLTDPRLQPGHK